MSAQDSRLSGSPSPEAVRRISGNPVLEQLTTSYSGNWYVEGDIPEADIEVILISGARAQSAKNAQPWHFTVISNYEDVKRMHENSARGNIVIVVSGKKENVTDTVEFDCGIAAAYIQLAAEAMGYGARMLIYPVGTIERDRVKFGIPDDYHVLAGIIIGTKDSADTFSHATPRNPLSSMVNFAAAAD